MNELYEQFIEYVSKEQKEEAVLYFLNLLHEGHDLIELYEHLLIRSMYEIDTLQDGEKLSIWGEHVRSGIIRTIIEVSYPYLLKIKKETTKEKVIVLCPEQEFHELGARIVADYFTISGFDVTFIGANTPKSEFVMAINEINPDYIAISVTNYYNLVHTKRTIETIKREALVQPRIIVGGQVFEKNRDLVDEVGADLFINTLESISTLGGDAL
jgi:methanogenic corrinoid protein MtbC1